MIKLKFILYIIGLLLSIYYIVLKYIKEKRKPKLYDFVFPIIFLWLVIKNIQKL
jgi:hypothetical protein